MVINSRTISLSEAAAMLSMTEQDVLRLSQYGYLEQSKPEEGRTMISMKSIEKYAIRSGLASSNAPFGDSGSHSMLETMTKLGLHSEAAVHRLIQSGRLQARMKKGVYKIDAVSIRNYVIGV